MPRLPRPPRRVHVERRRRKVEVLVRLLEVQRRHQLPVPHRQQHLVHARDARRRRGVSNVALHRSQRADVAPILPRTEHARQRLELDRIAQLRAGAVQLHVADRLWIDPVALVHLPLQRALARPTGRGDAIGLAVLVDAGADDHSMDRVTVPLRILQPLQHQRPNPVARHESIGTVVHRLAAALSGQHPRRAHPHVRSRREIQRHPAHQRHLNLAAPQPLARQMRGHQSRGTRCVHRDRRPLQVQDVGDA